MLTLHIDPPLLRAQAERLEGTLLAQYLCLVDELIAAIVACAGISLGIFI